MKWLVVAAAALLAIPAAPASAQTLQYTLNGTDLDGTVEYARFRLNAMPTVLPNNVGPGEGFRLKFVPGVFRYGDTLATLQDLQFGTDAIGGGFFNLDPADKTGATIFLNVTGPQLFTGTEAKPTLIAGDFTVFDAYSGAPLSLSIAAVPEPATWALMILGFGAVGGAVRRRSGVAVGERPVAVGAQV